MKQILLAITMTLGVAFVSSAATGSFIQLNREAAKKSVEDWKQDLADMKQAGIDHVVVQWSAEPPVMYFLYSTNSMPYISERYPTLENLFEANREIGLSVQLGLINDPHYWNQIQGRDLVLRDFFLIRIARNEQLQLALLDRFGNEKSWTGYYIPDEIDDINWRKENRLPLIKRYIAHMSERLKVNDPNRSVAVSAFFRGRTAPNIVAENLADITEGSKLDILMLQDGVGVGNPPLEYVPFYYRIIQEYWTTRKAETPAVLAELAREQEDSDSEPVAEADETVAADEAVEMPEEEVAVAEEIEIPALPELWAVVEAFEQTSEEGAPFTAKPAVADRFAQQLDYAEEYFENMVIFTYLDYMDPALGGESKALFQTMEERTQVPSTQP